MNAHGAKKHSVAAEPLFDEKIHAAARLRVCGVLRSVGEMDFTPLAQTLGLSQPHLSKVVRALAEIGYVVTTKRPSPLRPDSRQTVTLALTAAGRDAFDRHLLALQQLARGIDVWGAKASD
ncbi:transcriptional regulator [Microbacterium testaceum]|uniref:transcriptional regulator n=1 Tax=Microbacterium testaceum TaxID=2033 RepID=UPI002AC64FE9|nr:transcriptional regulator [Microbacterium testaceum]MDZ5145945.1 transcriptional regulator [Microbacterium testaceum]